MKITKATEYALRAISHLAVEPDRVRSAPALSRDTGIPGRFLAKICSHLVAAGLLTSFPGARGGFQLARPPRRISVWEVVSAVEDDPRLVECIGPGGECEEIDSCGLRTVWTRAQKAMEAELERTTLDEVVKLTKALQNWPATATVEGGSALPPGDAAGRGRPAPPQEAVDR